MTLWDYYPYAPDFLSYYSNKIILLLLSASKMPPLFIAAQVSHQSNKESFRFIPMLWSIKATPTVITINHFRWNRKWEESLIKSNIITSWKCVVFFISLSANVLPFFIYSVRLYFIFMFLFFLDHNWNRI